MDTNPILYLSCLCLTSHALVGLFIWSILPPRRWGWRNPIQRSNTPTTKTTYYDEDEL